MFNDTIPQSPITCADVLIDVSEEKLGAGTVCAISGSSSLTISYGNVSNPENKYITLQLRGTGFGSSIFARNVPSFSLLREGNETSCGYFKDNYSNKYEDFVATWSVVNSTGTGIFTYIWSYAPGSGNGGPPLPENSTSYDFKFWTATAGETYSLMVTQKDEANEHFSYSQTGFPFTVLSSCSTPGDCQQIVWKLSCDPGAVQIICTDSVARPMCSKTVDETNSNNHHYLILTSYEVENVGGPLKLDHRAFVNPSQNLKDFTDNVSCGGLLTYPSVAVEKDADIIQSSNYVFNISGNVTERGKIISKDYQLEWEATNNGNTSFCTMESNTPICTFPLNSLTFGVSYTYTLKLILTCETSTVWDSIDFTTFAYGEIISSPIIPLLPISPGIIEIEPMSGIAFQTEFEITTKDWEDSTNENAELDFRFGYQIKNEPIIYLTAWTPSSQWKGTLPAGGSSLPSIIVSGRNKQNITNNLTKEIIIFQPSFQDEDQKNIYINNLLAEVEKDQPMEKLKSLLKFKSLFEVDEELEDTENECGDCGQHGSCNPLNHSCICEDWPSSHPHKYSHD